MNETARKRAEAHLRIKFHMDCRKARTSRPVTWSPLWSAAYRSYLSSYIAFDTEVNPDGRWYEVQP